MIIFAVSMFLMACSKDKNTPSDPRMAFVGEYRSIEHALFMFLENHGSYSGDDTSFTVAGGSKLKVTLATTNNDSLELDMEEIIDDAMTALYANFGVPFSVEFATNPQVKLSATNQFGFEGWPFELTYLGKTVQCFISGQGQINGSRLLLEYETVHIVEGPLDAPELTMNLQGEIELDKQ